MPTIELVKSEGVSVLSTQCMTCFSFSQNLSNKGKKNNEKKEKKKT
jgi:hypothetical protein